MWGVLFGSDREVDACLSEHQNSEVFFVRCWLKGNNKRFNDGLHLQEEGLIDVCCISKTTVF